MNVEPILITYKQIRNNTYTIADDPYQIASYVLTPSRITTGINCPFNISEDNCAFFFVNVDGVVAARAQHFGTQFYAGGEIIPSGTASSLETAEPYRSLAIGAEVMLFAITNKEYTTFITSGISEMALPLYKKLRYHVLEFPRIMQLRNGRCILESRGWKGSLLKIGGFLVNIPLKVINKLTEHKGQKLLKDYQIEKVTKVPDWVDDMVLKDGHKYMEAHDHRWLQWNLDFNFRDLSQNIQSFYIIKDSGYPIGFFMTKERFRERVGGALKNVLVGSIVEWGMTNGNKLSEADIYKMAMTTFTPKVDIVETATASPKTVKEMKFCGFIPHGYAHIAFKDKKNQYKDASDIDLWRIRYGYADVILT